MGASTFAIIAGLVSSSILDIINYREEIEHNALLNASLVGEYCRAPLMFGYKDEAEDALKKLEAIPDIANACVFDNENKLFAVYYKNPGEEFVIPDLSNQETVSDNDFLNVFKPLVFNDEKYGTVYLRVSIISIKEKIFGNILVIVLLLILLAFPIYLLSLKLQKLISDPIMGLAEVSQNIAEGKNNSVKVSTDRKDEIGILYYSFNDMLAKLNKRQQEVDSAANDLKKLNEELEDRVKIRTRELQKINEELKNAKNKIEDANKDLLYEIESHKITEKALLNSEQRLKNILDYAPILVYINDLHGRYIFVNKEFEKLMGLSLNDVIDKTDLELFTKERAERNIAQNKKVIETKSPQIFENASQKKDGIHYFVDILFPIVDSNNEIYATCGWSIDITDRKKSEQVLKEAKEKAESADRLKSAFLATMSHELRTPLNSIIGFTGILMKGIAGPLNEEQIKQLGMAKGSAQHLLELINDVLDISKIEAGQLVVSLNKFDYSKTLKKIFLSFEPIAEKKNLKMELEINEDVIEINSDERRVGQILLNLINNAVKFTETGSVTVKCYVQNKEVITNIIDTGIGISEVDMDKLFKPFSQVDTGLTRNHEGTGLGLSISLKLAEKLGGTIKVQSKESEGSTFTLILPLN